MQFEIPEATIKYVIDLANSKGIPVLWNFAPARAFDLSYIPKVTILVLNEVEAGFLAQMHVENEKDAEKAAEKVKKDAEKNNFEVFMVTPDKDFAQLVTDNVVMYKPARMGNGIAWPGVNLLSE